MNVYFLVAGVLSLVGSLIHAIGGEMAILMRMEAAVFPTMPNGDGAQAKAETRMVWHGLTVYFGLAGALLLLLAFDQFGNAEALGAITALHFGAWALLMALLPALTLHKAAAALRSPQWVLLLAIALLAYAGSLV